MDCCELLRRVEQRHRALGELSVKRVAYYWDRAALGVGDMGNPLARDHIGISSKATPYCTPSVSPTCWQLLLRNESGLKDGSPRLSM